MALALPGVCVLGGGGGVLLIHLVDKNVGLYTCRMSLNYIYNIFCLRAFEN